MHPSGPASKQLQQQEATPDAAGLEPSVAGPGGIAGQVQFTRTRAAKGPPPLPSKRSWISQPVSVSIILALAMPSVIEQIISAAIGFTDTIVAGHTGADDNLRAASAAAVGSMTYLQWFAGLMTSALGVGATAIVARSIGAGRPRIANRVAGTACTAAFLVGILVAVIFYFGAWPLVWLFGLRDDAADLGIAYLQIMCWTVCFQTAGQIGMACLRGAGDTVRPLVATFAIALVNGIASPALTFGWWGLPAWGVRGNATGTLLAFAVAGIFTFGFLFWGDAGLKLRFRHLRIVPHLLERVARIGVPSWLEGILLWTGQALIVVLVMRPVDDAVGVSGVTMAAHNAALRIESLAFLPGYGFGIACSALVGQYLGAKKPDQAERSTVLCNRLAFWTMVIAAIPMVFFPAKLIGFLVESKPVIEIGWVPLVLAGLAQPGFAFAIIKGSALRGAGDTVSPMLTTLIGMGSRVVIVLIIMWILAAMGHARWGLIAVWICICLDLGFRGLAMEVVFRRGKWKSKVV